MEKISVVIITYNEEQHIARCIDSVKLIADEIIVLDSYSTDNTINIARSGGAKVYTAAFSGYVLQKNKALKYATYNYVLSLDGDEALDYTLAANILKLKQGFTVTGYTMNRCSNYCGKFIKFGTWYPDKKLRLFEKQKAVWGGLDPHDKVILQKPSTVQHIEGNILHYSYSSIKDHDEQNRRFSSIAAHSNYIVGKKTNRFKILANPAWAFVHDFILRLGFLNGPKGWIIAVKQAHYTYLKHRKIFDLQNNKKTGLGLSAVNPVTKIINGKMEEEIKSLNI